MGVTITFPTYFEDIAKSENETVEVCVQLENGDTHVVLLATTKTI
jgi:hypothetical protein